MAIPQKKIREIILQFLFATEMGNCSPEELQEIVMQELGIPKTVANGAFNKAIAILEQKESLDLMIDERSEGYCSSRIHTLEKNILRIALFEMFFDIKNFKKTDSSSNNTSDESLLIQSNFQDSDARKIIISEAIRLSRKFGSETSSNFVNAVLDSKEVVIPQEELSDIELEIASQEFAAV